MPTINKNVPFVANTADNKHCLPAAYAMIRQYFEPGLQIDWDEWSVISGYVPGKGSWSMAGLMWFKDRGYDVVHVAEFDYVQFALRGPDYLVEALDEEVARWDIQNTDFEAEQARAARFMKTGIWIKRAPTIEDIRHYLRDGYIIKCSVNLHALDGKPGYLSHAVVVKGVTETHVILHDPGLPPRPERQVAIADFQRAWSHPNMPGSEKLDALRRLPHRPRVSQGFGRLATKKRATTPPTHVADRSAHNLELV